MKNRVRISALIVSSFAISSTSYAFWDQSHQLISEIAGRKISNKSAKEIDRLLNIAIASPGSEELSKNTNTIDTAASWADSIKAYKNTNSNDNFAMCHYTDIPLTKDMIGKEIDEDLAMNKLNEVVKNETFNSVNCLKSAVKTLVTANESDLNKAISLRMVLHIVGDIGQPLHSAALTDGAFEDAGGNKVKLERVVSFSNIDGSSSSQNNMHKIWDGSLGVYLQFPYNPEDSKKGIFTPEEKKATKYDATEIVNSKDFLNLVAKITKDPLEQSVEGWVVDSYKVAVKNVYSGLILKGPDDKNNGMTSLFSDSWKMYQVNRKQIVETQIKKSGIRLYMLLNSIFDPSKSKVQSQYSTLVNSIQNDSSVKPFRVN